MWHGLARLLPSGWSRTHADPLLELAEAYRAFKAGKATARQAQIIVADLADFSGFFKVNPSGMTPDERSYAEGARSTFARMQSGLLLTDEEFIALQEAARLEALASTGQGQI